MTFFELIDLIVVIGVMSVLLTLFWQRIRTFTKNHFEQ